MCDGNGGGVDVDAKGIPIAPMMFYLVDTRRWVMKRCNASAATELVGISGVELRKAEDR